MCEIKLPLIKINKKIIIHIILPKQVKPFKGVFLFRRQFLFPFASRVVVSGATGEEE